MPSHPRAMELLRLADILDYDEERAPYVLFQYMGLNHPRTAEKTTSRDEFQKNMAGCFHLNDSHKKIHYSAKCTDPNIHEGLKNYLKWVEDELRQSSAILSERSKRWKDLQLPYAIIDDIAKEGYEAIDFKLTIDQERIIELLVGKNIYSDPGVFVRELLQNSIDAVLDRNRLDIRFKLDDGKIDIYTWRDEDGTSWFRIEDNGTGMDRRILQNYFLKVGCSYYTSKEYKMSEKRTDIKPGFKPTSRFGIGILSCFLSNPEQNQVEVETKRFSEDRKNLNETLRLFIPNLHSSYYLINKGTKKMHFPKDESKLDRFRDEAGTTICVGISPYSMCGMSFRELLDKYVVFPEVQVIHHDLSEKDEPVKKYPTLRTLMTLVERICGKDNYREYSYHISDSVFENLKQKMPDWNWNDSNRPEIVFTFYRYDLLSQNTAGVECQVHVKTAVNTKLPFSYKDEEYETSLKTEAAFSVRSDGTLNISIGFKPSIGEYVSSPTENAYDITKSFRDQLVICEQLLVTV